MKNLLLFALSSCAVLTGSSATVRDVLVRSHWPWDNKVDVHYVLESDRPVDIVLSAMTNGVPMTIPSAALSGDLVEIESGVRKITLDPTKAGLTAAALENFVATVTPTTAKTYMIVDLSDGLANTVAARVTYTNEVIGTQTASNADATWKLWDDYYKTNAIVFRRCRAGTFLMGSPTTEKWRSQVTATSDEEKRHRVTLTKGFYIGVFEVTQAQYKKLNSNANPSNFKGLPRDDFRPVEKVRWHTVRTQSWPQNPASSMTTGPIANLSALVGRTFIFDLPTEAQWEYACRAGTTTELHNGKNITCDYNAAHDSALDAIARYAGDKTNTGSAADTDPAEGGTALVGSYQPNNWGVFDMTGNVWEWCLDRKEDWINVPEHVVDPIGPSTGEYYLRKGGAHINNAGGRGGNRPASSARSSTTISDAGHYQGVRICLTLD